MEQRTHEVWRLDGMIGASQAMRVVMEAVAQAALRPFPVLVTGESGVGKELVAGALHRLSSRSRGPFVAINCAALPADLVESELFGHARGAFTGATTASEGAFGGAHGGTLFLDEIGELPLSVQPKLLRALETFEVRPVGTARTRRVDVRVVAATNRDLRAEAAAGRFRADLLYRLDVLSIFVPPLRSRPEDLRALAPHLLRQAGHCGQIDPEALRVLLAHRWPGNVRELRNVLLRAMRAADAPLALVDVHAALPDDADVWSLPHGLRDSAFHYAEEALDAWGGHRRLTFEALGVSKSTFYRWLRAGKVRPPDRAPREEVSASARSSPHRAPAASRARPASRASRAR